MIDKETIKKLKDKEWRMTHLYQIKDQDQNKVVFKPNRAQAHFNANKHTRNIILKSRQLGFTTFEAIDCLDDTLFTPNFNALMINYEKDQAINVFKEKINFAWENLPKVIRDLYEIDTNRANQLTFDFGAKSGEEGHSYSTIAVRVSGRSGTNNRVHVSEFAKMCRQYPQKAVEIIDGTIPSVPFSGRVDIESTAEGSDGLFYDMFWEAWNRERDPHPTEFKAHFYNWRWDDKELSKITHVIPFSMMDQGKHFEEYAALHNLTGVEITYYYLKWLASEKKWSSMYQNYPTTPEEAFVGSGHKLFLEEELKQLKHTLKNGRMFEDWTIYEPYIEGHYYCIGCDVAEGTGQDSSTIVVIDVTDSTARVVATYKSNKIPPDLFAYEIVRGANWYGAPIVGVERNNTGHTTLTILKGMYGNLYTEVTRDKVTDVVTEKLGWWTSGLSKPKMLFELAEAIRDKQIEITSKSLYEELRTYDKEDLRKTKFDPEQTKHWDLLMAFAIAWQMKAFAYDSSETELYRL